MLAIGSIALALVLVPNPAFASESRYQAGNVSCAHGFVAVDSTAKGSVDHRLDNYGTTTQKWRENLGFSSFLAPWHRRAYWPTSGGAWSYATNSGGTTGIVVAGSVNHYCQG